MADETPLLRADATDDDLQHEADTPGESSDTVDAPAPKRMVPVIVEGVFHGMREE